MRAVGIQESTLQIHDFPASPVQHQPGLLCDHSHSHSLQILLPGISQELVHVRRVNHHGHPLLRL